MRNTKYQEHRNSPSKGKKRTRKIRPIPILIVGFCIDIIIICLTTFCFGSLAYFFQWKIEHFQTFATVVYLFAIYLSSLLVSFIAGHRYPLIPLLNGLFCLGISLLLLLANDISMTEHILSKISLVAATALAAYFTVILLNLASAPKKTRQRVPIAERSRALERNSLELH